MHPCRTCLAVSFPRVFFPRHPLTAWPGSGTAFHCVIESGSMKQVQSSSHNSLTVISFTIGPTSFVGGAELMIPISEQQLSLANAAEISVCL